ncbi:hypothetical protein LEP1GSC108_4562 [Leptospira weilii str. UI 13098]|uniref:Uncharacterized protein n=1 Tax=Leptospira weilii str. UI 13098 TaxID=1088542 RepID=M6Q1C0_9LEPT|nr:hypothetical protein LEP1GSC108_4562 [Leptospira weilii str. UI 13098]
MNGYYLDKVVFVKRLPRILLDEHLEWQVGRSSMNKFSGID